MRHVLDIRTIVACVCVAIVMALVAVGVSYLAKEPRVIDDLRIVETG